MHPAADGDLIAASLTDWLAGLAFADRQAAEVTDLIVESVAAWGAGRGWRVYRRAPSVLPLPPPMQHRRSCLDVACARPTGAPVAIEVDNTDRRRTVDKLLAEAAAGRIAIWVRWGTGRFEPPPAPVHLVGCPVTARRPLGAPARLYSRVPTGNRPAPEHSPGAATGRAARGRQADLLPELDPPPHDQGNGERPPATPHDTPG